MNKILATMLALAVSIPSATAFAEDVTVNYDGKKIEFTENSIVLNNRTLVQLRPVAEALGLSIEYATDTGAVIVSNAENVVVFNQDSCIVNVNGVDTFMDVPMMAYNGYSFVPIRNLVEPFGKEIIYNANTNSVIITSNRDLSFAFDNFGISTGTKNTGFPFFYQSQPDLGFENNGRGYCWVCSYAMLFSGASQKVVTPIEVANYNIEKGYSGNYMAGHTLLAKDFGFQLVPALSEDSPYFGGFNLKNRGETTLNVTCDDDVRAALREALDSFPGGVLVRYEGYPHSMMAVAYDDEYIYFNDPGMSSGEYVTFENTCLKRYSLSDISFVQAVR